MTTAPSFLDNVRAASAALFGTYLAPAAEEVDRRTVQMMGDSIEGGATGDYPVKRRTHHPWLHPTKGWRKGSRPAGTNRRRRIIPALASEIAGSHVANRRKDRSGFRWPKMTPEEKRKFKKFRA